MTNRAAFPYILKLRLDAEPAAGEASATTGGCFANPAGVLAFLGAAAEARLADSALCRRSPAGTWWAEIAAPWAAAAALIRTAGGHPYSRAGAAWLATAPGDRLPATDTTAELTPELWPLVEPTALLAETPLRPGQLTPPAALAVIVPGSLGRWVLKRALALAIKVGIVPALRRPLQSEQPADGVLLLRLQARQGVIPPSLARAIASLPYTLLAQAAPLGSGRLLVDSRYRLPLAEPLLEGLIPADRSGCWVGPTPAMPGCDCWGQRATERTC